MRLRLAVLAAAAVVVLDACQSPANGAASTASLADADRKAIQALLDSAESAIKAHNYDKWVAVFTDDAIFQPPNHPAIHGRTAIRAWADTLPPVSDFSFSNANIDGAGGLAWGTSALGMTLAPPGAAPMKDVAKQLIVWKRQSDGSWKTVAVSYSSDLPLPTAAPAAPKPSAKKGK